jgi:hypothetical protein
MVSFIDLLIYRTPGTSGDEVPHFDDVAIRGVLATSPMNALLTPRDAGGNGARRSSPRYSKRSADRLKMDPSTMLHHLRILDAAGGAGLASSVELTQ